jgi:hypothetical protein
LYEVFHETLLQGFQFTSIIHFTVYPFSTAHFGWSVMNLWQGPHTARKL